VHLDGALPSSPEDNVALLVDDGARTFLYATSCLDVRELEPHVAGVGVLLVDGTFFTEDELVRLGLGTAPARSMAHQPISGDSGSLAVLAAWPIARRIYTHINNTNPILDDGSKEAARVLAAGIEIARDGMEIHA
jgi:pyrroloquinoline quinone biosynthesis protein B